MTKLIAIISILALTSTAWSHSGGTNAQGCHNDHIHGGYHCHKANEPMNKDARKVSSVKHHTKHTKKSKK